MQYYWLALNQTDPRFTDVKVRQAINREVDLGVSRRLAPLAKGADTVLIAESGIKTRAEIDELSTLGFKGFLIGTAFIQNGRPGRALAELLGRKA